MRDRLSYAWYRFTDSDGFRLAFAAAYLIGSVIVSPFLMVAAAWRWLREQ